MAKLKESRETLEAIRTKALYNAKKLGTYNTRSSFDQARNIITFSDICKLPRRASF